MIEKHEALEDLFFLAPTAMIVTDLDSTLPVAANDQALQLLGLTAQAMEQIRTTEFWEDPQERARLIQRVRDGECVRSFRVQLRKADGRRFWANIASRKIRFRNRDAVISTITDVSEAVAAEEVLHRTQQTLSTLLEASPFPLIVTRLDNGEIRYCNQKAADMFETPLSGLLGHTAPQFYVDPSDRNWFVDKLRTVGKVENFVAKLKTSSGQPFWAMLSAKTLELNGEPVFMVAFADVSKQKAKEEELETLAFKDALTDAYNRRYFIEAARIELARAERSNRRPCLALIDIDHFKRLNDTHGHEAGDAVLREFVRVVRGLLRKPDILARYGGEEFVILLPETALDGAREILQRIHEEVAAHRFTADGKETHVTFSAGLVMPADNEDYASLLARADDALYTAKRRGRNRVETAKA